jgi:hypothetical protein
MDEQRELSIDIPEEQASQQALIPLLDDELTAAMTTTGNIFVSVPGICKALGLNAALNCFVCSAHQSYSKGCVVSRWRLAAACSAPTACELIGLRFG